MVSPRNYFLYTPLLPSAATGTVEPRSIVDPVRSHIPDTVLSLTATSPEIIVSCSLWAQSVHILSILLCSLHVAEICRDSHAGRQSFFCLKVAAFVKIKTDCVSNLQIQGNNVDCLILAVMYWVHEAAHHMKRLVHHCWVLYILS